jgi:hypothetical protein
MDINGNKPVRLKYKGVEIGNDFDFFHALNILRADSNFSPTGNHEFIKNELIIKPSVTDSTDTAKPSKGKKGGVIPK